MKTHMSANGMFKVLTQQQGQSQLPQVMVNNYFLTNVSETTKLWHRGYEHLNYKILKSLKNKKMVEGLPKLSATSEICSDCLIGKHHRDPIPNKCLWRAAHILDLVHVDICGPINPTSNSNKRYILCFIDDYIQKFWIYFLAEKSEAFSYFTCFVKLVSNKAGFPLKCLCTDRGREFTSSVTSSSSNRILFKIYEVIKVDFWFLENIL